MERINAVMGVILTALLGLVCGGFGYGLFDYALGVVAGEVNTVTQDVQAEVDYRETIAALIDQENEHTAAYDVLLGRALRDTSVALDSDWLLQVSNLSEEIFQHRNVMMSVQPPPR